MSLRARKPSTSQDAEPLRRIDRILEIVALAMFPLGLTALLLGWLGVASTGHVFLQLPYLVSGGLVGVALVTAGGLLYLASWVSRTAAVQRRQNAQILAALLALQEAGGLDPDVDTGAVPMVATPRGSMFHRPDCQVVSGRSDVHPITAQAGDLKPCGMCDPLGTDQHPAHSTD